MFSNYPLVSALMASAWLTLCGVPQAMAADKRAFSATAGVVVARLGSGEVLINNNGDQPLAPASLMKLVTSWAAFEELGPNYTVKTSFLGQGGPKGGVKRLIVHGHGAPDMTSETLYVLASLLRRRGVTGVEEIIVDPRTFRGGPTVRGERAYEAAASGVSLNFNSLGVEVCPASGVGKKALVGIEPAEYRRSIAGEVSTAAGSGNNVTFSVPEGEAPLRVGGTIGVNSGCVVVYRSMPDPELYFGRTLAGFLDGFGAGRMPVVKAGPVGDDLKDVTFRYEHRSKPLASFVADMNTYSNNFIAEQLVHLLGQEDVHYDYDKGLARIRGLAQEKLMGEIVAFDGSGLDRRNRVTAKLLVQLIRRAIASPVYGIEFERSLAVTGRTGTLASRRIDLPEGSLRAKTGSLTGVHGLAGTLVPKSGNKVVFAIIQNDTKSRERSLQEERRFIEDVYARF